MSVARAGNARDQHAGPDRYLRSGEKYDAMAADFELGRTPILKAPLSDVWSATLKRFSDCRFVKRVSGLPIQGHCSLRSRRFVRLMMVFDGRSQDLRLAASRQTDRKSSGSSLAALGLKVRCCVSVIDLQRALPAHCCRLSGLRHH